MNKLRNRKAVIFGLRGIYLTKPEKKLIKKFKPWGIILFSRNIKNLNQLKLLVNSIKDTINDANYPIMIDQEGGTVSRLNKIIDLTIFSQSFFGNLYKYNKKNFFLYYKIYINQVADILKQIGININIAPVLDIKNGLLIKGVNLEGLRVLGIPRNFANHYYLNGKLLVLM